MTLKELYNELGTLQWMGIDEGWDLAIEAVRERIREGLEENNKEWDKTQEQLVIDSLTPEDWEEAKKPFGY